MRSKRHIRLLVIITVGWLVWAGWIFLAGSDEYVVRVLDDQGVPVVDAEVAVNSDPQGVSDEEGLVSLGWSGETQTLAVSAAGHSSTNIMVPDYPQEPVDVVIRAKLLRGRVTTPDKVPVEGAYVRSGRAVGISDADGRFVVRGASPGTINVTRPAWHGNTFEWAGGPGEEVVTIEPRVLKAVHVGGEAAANNFDRYISMAKGTELNAIMLDLKDESGYIWYESEVEMARSAGAVNPLYDLESLVEKADAADLYLIGRITTFQDPVAAQAIPDMAAWDTATDQPHESGGQYFLDPSNEAARQYGLDLADEACAAGVDEIQFDYLRYPDDRPESVEFEGGVTGEARVSAIRSFLTEATSRLHPQGCAVAADIFGFITRATDDGGIGQNWEQMLDVVDVASPMVYPSHYGSGWYNLDNPNDHPATLVEEALADGMERLPRAVVVRPWLQDFGYTASQVRSQIEEVEKHGLGWMLWNALSEVSTGALTP
ncbi:MAG: hypothetical protein GEU79_01045 [Acidimicrobiia bacterium]|nr:hypothetical protein [Acidimicrobiia bacterium]